MFVSLNKIISSKTAVVLSTILCLPFLFAITTAVTGAKPFIDLIANSGRATTFGLVVFYIGLIGLPLTFLVNLLSMTTVKLIFSKWSIEGKVSFRPLPLNLIIGSVCLLVAVVFGSHLLLDSIACFYGNISACD